MGILKKLAGQTAIYGLSSILGRIINYFLTPLYVFAFTTAEYGEVTEMYAYVAFLIIILTYGMETAFFKFSNDSSNHKVYDTALTSLFFTSSIFIFFSFIFSQNIANWIHYENNPEYVRWFALILGIDAFSSIPLAKLRQDNNAKKFAMVNLASIFTNIFFNLLFIGFGKYAYENEITSLLYSPEIGVGFIFISNLLGSVIKPLLLYNEIKKIRFNLDFDLLKKMLVYSSPLLVAGLAGIVNETIDRILIRRILEPVHGIEYAKSQVGIYGGVYKLSILISLFIQAFRYAAEPFFFAQLKEKDSHKTYALVMNYFVLFVCVIFLGITLYIDIFKWFLPNHDFWGALHIVPVLLLANIFLGIYYNQSIWYKLSGQTKFGAYIAIYGAIVTLILNFLFVPLFGYVASAYITFLVYFTMSVWSYYLGKKYYPIKYQVRKVMFFIIFSVFIFAISWTLRLILSPVVLFLSNTILLMFFGWVVYNFEKDNIQKLLKGKL